MLNDGSSWLIVPIWAFLGGSFYGLAVYWLGGGLLFGAARRLGSLGTYRRARHVLALSGAPLALSLFTLWPIRIAIYGEWFFRTGGNDYGTGDRVFNVLVVRVIRLVRGAPRHRCARRTRLELGEKPRHSWARRRGTGGARDRDARSSVRRAQLAALERGLLLLRHRVRVLLLGERAAAHLARVGRERVADLAGEVRVALDEAGEMTLREAEQVVVDEHLAVTVRAGADPDRRDRQLARDARCDR